LSDADQRGSVITFYSYKGGTGRSMALANVACLLAVRPDIGKPVLAIDWDLEAPGLHRFFQGRLWRKTASNRYSSSGIDDHPGLIDLFWRLNALIGPERATDLNEAELHANEVLSRIDLDEYLLNFDRRNLMLIKAGRFDAGYATRVNTFDWESLHMRSPFLFAALAERLAAQFSFVLIDSRTGLTDTSGICTSLMPEKLVTVFTPNRQSLGGVAQLIREAASYRSRAEDERPLLVYPLPSRIESNRDDLRNDWRYGNAAKEIDGYQPEFEKLFAEIYGLSECSLERYFNDVQIQQSQDYAYGEEVAALLETKEDRFSLKRSYKTFLEWIETSSKPWERVETVAVPIEEVREIESKALAAEETARGLASRLRYARLGLAAAVAVGVIGAMMWLLSLHRAVAPNIDGWIMDVALSEGGDLLAARNFRGDIKVWSTTSGKVTFAGLTGKGVAFLSQKDSLVVVGSQGADLWSAPDNRQTLYATPEESIYDVAFSLDGNWVVTGALSESLSIRNLRDGTHAQALTGAVGTLQELAVSKDGRFVASITNANDKNTLSVWKVGDSNSPAYQFSPQNGTLFGVTFSPAGDTLLATSSGEVLTWALNALQRSPEQLLQDLGFIDEIAFSPDGKFLVLDRGNFATVGRIEGSKFETLADLSGHKDSVESIAFSGDSTILAIGGQDSRILVWSVADLAQPPKEIMFE
jgi:WD40 repeat protein